MTITLSALRELYRHEYEGTVNVENKAKAFQLPFHFSDMTGRLHLTPAPGVKHTELELIREKSLYLVLDRIVRPEF